MRRGQEVRGSVVFFSLCGSVFLLCGDTALISIPFYFLINRKFAFNVPSMRCY